MTTKNSKGNKSNKSNKSNKNKDWQTTASSPINLTEVIFNWISDDFDNDTCIAMGRITLNNAININIRVIDTGDNRFVSMPTIKNDEKYYNLVFISDVDVMDNITNQVLDRLDNQLANN